jgi:MrfA Zn-binding domain
MVTTAGVGAIVDLPAMSVIVRGLDIWGGERQEMIDEPRLLEEVRRVLGGQVRALRTAPWDPAESDDPYSRVGVPVTPFPRWVRCPRCSRLGPLDPPGQFQLIHRWGKRPDLAKIVHARCTRQANVRDSRKRACVPARFLVVCEDGHLDDFPYVEYVHAGAADLCDGPQLAMSDASSTLGPRVTVRCEECGAAGNIQRAAGRAGSANLPACRGRHPHLQQFGRCGKSLRLIVLGASNLWFGVTASALHLPKGQTLEDLVTTNWQILGAQPDPEVMQAIIDGMDALRGLRSTPIEEIWAQVEKLRAAGGPIVDGPARDLLDAEWKMLSRPTTQRQDPDFRAVPTPSPDGYDRLLDQVVLVSRLREVRALLGFTRLAAPERGDLEPVSRVPLSRAAPQWVPAVEQRGEGIFLQLRERDVAAWAVSVAEHPRMVALDGAYRQWAHNTARTPHPAFPHARLTLIHTLSHMLVRQVALECGYSSASIRERLYIGTPGEPMAGVLLSTAASDSEGTLGGLVALGHRRYLKRLLDQAFEDALRCSSDPLCAEHVPIDPSAELHAAACHACLFASETTCETNNRWLDRAVLTDLTGDRLAFPR